MPEKNHFFPAARPMVPSFDTPVCENVRLPGGGDSGPTQLMEVVAWGSRPGVEAVRGEFPCIDAAPEPSEGYWSRWAFAGSAAISPSVSRADATSSGLLFMVRFPPGLSLSIESMALDGLSARDDQSPHAMH